MGGICKVFGLKATIHPYSYLMLEYYAYKIVTMKPWISFSELIVDMALTMMNQLSLAMMMR